MNLSPSVAAVLANRPLAARLAVVVGPAAAVSGTCATPTCANDHPAGCRYCPPCRAENDLARRRRWWAANRGAA